MIFPLAKTGVISTAANMWLAIPIGIVFGFALLLADRFSARYRDLRELRLSHALWIGAAQALSLIPGTSRSGVTITVGRLLGIARQDAALSQRIVAEAQRLLS